MAIVGYPDYVPAAHDALARAAREGVAVLQFDNDDRIIYIVLQFATDERRIARQVGVELCRRLGTTGGRWGAIALRRPLHTVPRPRRPHNRRHRRLRDQLPLQAGGEDRGNTALKLFTFHGPDVHGERPLDNALLVDDTITCVITTSDDSRRCCLSCRVSLSSKCGELRRACAIHNGLSQLTGKRSRCGKRRSVPMSFLQPANMLQATSGQLPLKAKQAEPCGIT